MQHSALDLEDFHFLRETAAIARARQLDHFIHIDQAIGIWYYIRMANELTERFRGGRLLDWGCGYGQMAYLLRRRGFEVVAFDIGPSTTTLPEVPLTQGLDVVRTTHPTKLPFADESFDVVLSCGVLEHVDEFSRPGNERLSLLELARVLRPGGHLAIYQLPQRWSWTEALQRRLRLGYFHPRRYSESEIRALLRDAGYEVASVHRNNMLPHNLTGLPHVLRDFYARFSPAVLAVDGLLSRISGLNRLAGVLEVIARRPASSAQH